MKTRWLGRGAHHETGRDNSVLKNGSKRTDLFSSAFVIMDGHRKEKRKAPLVASSPSCWWVPGKWTIFRKTNEPKFAVEKQTSTTATVTTSETVTTIGSPLPTGQSDGIDQQQFVQIIHGDIEERDEQQTKEHVLLPRTCPTFMFQKLSKRQFLSRREGTVRYYRRLKGVTSDQGIDRPLVIKNQDSLPASHSLVSDTRDESKPEVHVSRPNSKRFLSPPALTCGLPSSSRINRNNCSAQASKCILSLPSSHQYSTYSYCIPCSLGTAVEEWMNKTLGWDSEPQTPAFTTPTTNPPIRQY